MPYLLVKFIIRSIGNEIIPPLVEKENKDIPLKKSEFRICTANPPVKGIPIPKLKYIFSVFSNEYKFIIIIRKKKINVLFKS